MTCHVLDRLVTPFIDGECTGEERAEVLAHLRQCPRCRNRVEAESIARQLLHAHAAVARTMGVTPPWRPRVFGLGRPTLPSHPMLLLVAATIAVGLFGFWLRPTPLRAVGVIGDSFCHREHRFITRFNDHEADCTLNCVKRGAEFVLVTDTHVYRIGNQQLPELAALANVRVTVEGTVDGDRLVVAKMSPVDAAPSVPAVQ